MNTKIRLLKNFQTPRQQTTNNQTTKTCGRRLQISRIDQQKIPLDLRKTHAETTMNM